MAKYLPHNREVDAERSARGHWTVTLPAANDDIPVQIILDDFAFHHLFKEAERKANQGVSSEVTRLEKSRGGLS